jgi:leucyl/phenylalanyl-tRNA--protein transferase
MPLKFPNPRLASPEGIVAFGEDLSPETLLRAYRSGIFPWPVDGLPLPWFCPEERAILELERLHLPRSLERAWKKHPYRLSMNEDFQAVMEACADAPRPGQDGTWVTDAMIAAYCRLHGLGHAHSVEVWDERDRLVGGLYGVEIDGCFAGESMFHRVPDASKLAVLFLMERIQEWGSAWIDIQQLTPHMERLGAREIARDEFLTKLAEAQASWRSRGSPRLIRP